MNVPVIRPAELGSIAPVEKTKPEPKVDLADSFANALKDAHAAEHTATNAAEQFARGDSGMGIHEVMIATEKANLSVR